MKLILATNLFYIIPVVRTMDGRHPHTRCPHNGWPSFPCGGRTMDGRHSHTRCPHNGWPSFPRSVRTTDGRHSHVVTAQRMVVIPTRNVHITDGHHPHAGGRTAGGHALSSETFIPSCQKAVDERPRLKAVRRLRINRFGMRRFIRVGSKSDVSSSKMKTGCPLNRWPCPVDRLRCFLSPAAKICRK